MGQGWPAEAAQGSRRVGGQKKEGCCSDVSGQEVPPAPVKGQERSVRVKVELLTPALKSRAPGKERFR